MQWDQEAIRSSDGLYSGVKLRGHWYVWRLDGPKESALVGRFADLIAAKKAAEADANSRKQPA